MTNNRLKWSLWKLFSSRNYYSCRTIIYSVINHWIDWHRNACIPRKRGSGQLWWFVIVLVKAGRAPAHTVAAALADLRNLRNVTTWFGDVEIVGLVFISSVLVLLEWRIYPASRASDTRGKRRLIWQALRMTSQEVTSRTAAMIGTTRFQ